MRTRETADLRRQSLIDAAAACLADRGVAGTSVRTICAEAGVSPGLLTHYFDGVDALIAATYRDVTAKVSARLAAAVEEAEPLPRERLLAFVTASFRPPIADRALLATWLAFWSLVKTNPSIAEIHRSTYADYRRDIEALLGECGLSPKEAETAAIALTALVDGLWLELTLDPSTFASTKAEAIATKWVDVLLASPSFD